MVDDADPLELAEFAGKPVVVGAGERLIELLGQWIPGRFGDKTDIIIPGFARGEHAADAFWSAQDFIQAGFHPIGVELFTDQV